MIITYLGGEFVKAQFGDTVIAFNPISKDAPIKGSRFGADIVLISLNDPLTNGIEQVNFGDKKAVAVTGPGEYEIKGVFIKGLMSSSMYGGEKRINTIYTVSLEGMNICYLGALDSPQLPSDTDEAIDEVDILFVPIGGDGVLTPSDAYKLAVSIEPKIVIPIHYGEVGDKDALKAFLKEAGANPKSENKLTIKKKDLEGKSLEIIVLDKEQ